MLQVLPDEKSKVETKSWKIKKKERKKKTGRYNVRLLYVILMEITKKIYNVRHGNYS